ncbi:hypothetical protein O181_061421 [Austropuccinia psidii MF-1]|uniref:Uncharacterized protein n=1 Tax=Austropuccinia psidii MF-1 TaxID=1389203 RepID=A0A9Q3EMR6_9BASI|nr:hypothetical protein [Austropuccinia psidii MF-1]
MPVQNSPPAKNTRSQRHQAVLAPTARAPLDCTPSVHKLSENLDRGPPMEGPRRRLGEAEDEEGEDSVEQEDSEESEVAAALESAS